MTASTLRLLATVAAAACALFNQAQAALVYSLASDGASLIRFDSATPGTVTTVGAISGDTNRLDGLDFRPFNGQLYGYSHSTGSAYTVTPSTGAVTFAAALSSGTDPSFLGIDFNPAADRMRIVTDSDQNLRVNVADGATVMDAALAYAAGDPNIGVNPGIIDAAYTNSSQGVTSSTALYYIDYVIDTLVTTSNPNGGVLNTVGRLGFDIDRYSGFDIFSDGGSNSAYASFRVGGNNGLYGINLATGAASLLGAIGDSTLLYGLAIVPGTAGNDVPEPDSLALFGVACLPALSARVRQRMGAQRAARTPVPLQG